LLPSGTAVVLLPVEKNRVEGVVATCWWRAWTVTLCPRRCSSWAASPCRDRLLPPSERCRAERGKSLMRDVASQLGVHGYQHRGGCLLLSRPSSVEIRADVYAEVLMYPIVSEETKKNRHLNQPSTTCGCGSGAGGYAR
jgi:hypothetical protein